MVYKPRKASGRLKAMADGILLCSVIKELSEAWKNIQKQCHSRPSLAISKLFFFFVKHCALSDMLIYKDGTLG